LAQHLRFPFGRVVLLLHRRALPVFIHSVIHSWLRSMGRYQCLVGRSSGVLPLSVLRGIDEVLRAERAAALLALVAVSIRIAAVGAGADDVAVRKNCFASAS
jgi:hypothetical protein